ncbi:hypothetical protein Acr_00g0096410 [Actinidia rufa]|uniref:Uncharacterized protein n=1 Tax=Actinidia rufa TaxID=165716 RepID=A0A7J0DZR7_9ERIC|nr:hypothetical protein Acr_00g0096410 [Actinidia rufa]
MLTGKRPTDSMFGDSLTLQNFVKMALPEQVASIADPTLFKGGEKGRGTSSSINNSEQELCYESECPEVLDFSTSSWNRLFRRIARILTGYEGGCYAIASDKERYSGKWITWRLNN